MNVSRTVNEDLQRERSNCSFDIEELTNLIDGGPGRTGERRDREEFMLRNSEVLEDVPAEYMSHKEKYEDAVKRSCHIMNMIRKMQDEGRTNINNYRDVISGLLGSSLVRDGSPLGLHYVMFMPALINLGDEQQQAQWLERAWNLNIIGSFAQTELGHGTFIRGLETTAEYDAQTAEFVLNTPTLTSTKWWPGGMGHTANYCVLMAQLYTRGRCHGVHAFILQLRDEDTHRPLPGVTVGCIGAKMGLNSVNNGFLQLRNVRIPRNQMLMKHARVTEDGTYVKSRNSKLNYGAMVFVRVVIVFDMVNYLSKAVTIATRYSAVRRQCQLKQGEPEVQILDYVTQQHKLLIAIATCHALRLTGYYLWDTFHEINEQLGGGNLDRLPELHALACCLKAVSTSDTAAHVERCRLACGGHGYMTSSNLPLTYSLVTAACTYEGENTVLLLQTARFLVKTWQKVDKSSLTPTVAYLRTTSQPGYSHKWNSSVDGIVEGFQIVAMKKIAACVENMGRIIISGKSQEEAWNMTSVDLVHAAEAHCRVIILSTYWSETARVARSSSAPLREVLTRLVRLYAHYWALEILCDLLLYTDLSRPDVDELKTQYQLLLRQVRPDAVGLVDGFDLRDDVLQSTLGAYDGRVYERLMEEAQKNPLNRDPVNHTFQVYLKPFMRGKL